MPLGQNRLVSQIPVGALSLTPLGMSWAGERRWGWWAIGVSVGNRHSHACVWAGLCGTCYKGMTLENMPSERNQTQRPPSGPQCTLGPSCDCFLCLETLFLLFLSQDLQGLVGFLPPWEGSELPVLAVRMSCQGLAKGLTLPLTSCVIWGDSTVQSLGPFLRKTGVVISMPTQCEH